jgi:hypothetical protein
MCRLSHQGTGFGLSLVGCPTIYPFDSAKPWVVRTKKWGQKVGSKGGAKKEGQKLGTKVGCLPACGTQLGCT